MASTDMSGSVPTAAPTPSSLVGFSRLGDLGWGLRTADKRLRRDPFKAISVPLGSLRLAAQDVALSRRKQGFESPRERQNKKSTLKRLRFFQKMAHFDSRWATRCSAFEPRQVNWCSSFEPRQRLHLSRARVFVHLLKRAMAGDRHDFMRRRAKLGWTGGSGLAQAVCRTMRQVGLAAPVLELSAKAVR